MEEHPFPYLAQVAERYGDDALQVISPRRTSRDRHSVVEELTAADMTELAKTYREILRRGDVAAISKWFWESKDAHDHKRRKLWLLFTLFELLGDRNIPPFSDGLVTLGKEPRPKLNWTKVPQSLQCLASAAERYGHLYESGEVGDFLENLDKAEASALIRVRELCEELENELVSYIDSHRASNDHEAWQLWWLLSFLDDPRVDEL